MQIILPWRLTGRKAAPTLAHVPNTTMTNTTNTNTTTSDLDARLAALKADHAAHAARVAALKAKADALHAKAEATWSAYRDASLAASEVRDFDLLRALRHQYHAERVAANRARGQVSAAYTRNSARNR